MTQISIVGCGAVGTSTAFALLLKHTAEAIHFIDMDEAKAKGEALDFWHSVPLGQPVSIRHGGYELCAHSDIVVVTAGAAQKPGETRLDLLKRNMLIMEQIVVQLDRYCPEAIVLIATNPVDVMTRFVCERSIRPAQRVIGSGTLLDSMRMRALIAQRLGIGPESVSASVIGEHGDTQVPVWSQVRIGSGSVQFEPEVVEEISRLTRTAAYEIIAAKGATSHAIGVALERICRAILRDEHAVLEVSSLIDGAMGLHNVCVGMPSVVCREGVKQVIMPDLTKEEKAALQQSADKLRESLASVGGIGE